MIWIERLIAIAILLQTIEQLQIRRYLSDPGLDPWAWRNEILNDYAYPALLWLRLVAALSAMFIATDVALAILLFTTWVIAVRWRGTFNGGSDAMTFHILIGLLIAGKNPVVGVYYIAVNLALSYFVAGLAKINSKAWRSGRALPRFLLYANAAHPSRFSKIISGSHLLTAVIAVAVIVFEILFPLVLFSPQSRAFFVGAGLLFHFANFYFFGLNRFFWAWTAAYPALFLV